MSAAPNQMSSTSPSPPQAADWLLNDALARPSGGPLAPLRSPFVLPLTVVLGVVAVVWIGLQGWSLVLPRPTIAGNLSPAVDLPASQQAPLSASDTPAGSTSVGGKPGARPSAPAPQSRRTARPRTARR